jgi:hypothetical protein
MSVLEWEDGKDEVNRYEKTSCTEPCSIYYDISDSLLLLQPSEPHVLVPLEILPNLLIPTCSALTRRNSDSTCAPGSSDICHGMADLQQVNIS